MKLTASGGERIKVAFAAAMPDAGAKLLLIMLAGWADDNSEIRVSLNAIAAAVCVSRPTAIKHLRTLEAAGLIRRGPSKVYRTNAYMVTL